MPFFLLYLLFISLLLGACTPTPTNSIAPTDHMGLYTVGAVDSLYQLVQQQTTGSNSLEDVELPLLFFWVGQLDRNIDEEQVIMIQYLGDEVYQIDLFCQYEHAWRLRDQVEVTGDLVAFYGQVEDVNFDHILDLYIQTSVSNGYVISEGHLILIDSLQHFWWIESAAELGNIQPDTIAPYVTSEEVIWCQEDGSKTACTLYHHWMGRQLVFDHKKCPCTPEQAFTKEGG